MIRVHGLRFTCPGNREETLRGLADDADQRVDYRLFRRRAMAG